MRAKWQRVRELFERALDEEPADFDEWLRREAPDDPDVRAEVRSLHENHSRAGEFLVKPVNDRYPILLNEDDDDPYEAGHVIGHYTIVRQLRPGGMGRLYLATDNLKRNVVLKAVATRFAGDPEHEERLRREAQALAELDHPGICRVYEFDEYDGESFIVTEYLNGRTLREEIAAGPRPLPGEVLRTARDIAAALACAHARKIAHRDLKPENVMRMPDGSIKLIDFGIARVDASDGEPHNMTLTQPGVVPGTPAYMAPEQLTGQHGDARSDVWAFGVLLYELASGVHPFEASTPAETVARIVQEDAIPIRAVCPNLPSELCSVIERCLKKWPAQRFESASKICVELDASPSRVPPPPVPPAPLPPAPVLPPASLRWWRAHQVVVIGLYFLACVSAWFAKEGLGPAATVVFAATAVFGIVTIAATVGGVLRGHLLFVERTNRRALPAERRRTDSVTLWTDAVIAMALVVDGVLLSMTTSHVAAALIAALGIGILLARLWIEPTSAGEAFGRLALP